jgi:hypothetical protein
MSMHGCARVYVNMGVSVSVCVFMLVCECVRVFMIACVLCVNL